MADPAGRRCLRAVLSGGARCPHGAGRDRASEHLSAHRAGHGAGLRVRGPADPALFPVGETAGLERLPVGSAGAFRPARRCRFPCLRVVGHHHEGGRPEALGPSDDARPAVTRPFHLVAVGSLVSEALDGRVGVLLAGVVVSAQPLAVVEAGRTAAAVRDDVVVLAHWRVAVRGAAATISQAQEALQGPRELAGSRLDGDDLPAGGVLEQLPQHCSDRGPVRAVAVAGRVLRCGEGCAQLGAQGFGGHRAVSLDVRRVAVLGSEQGPVGDDHADVEGLELEPAVPAEQGPDQRISHDRAVAFPVPLGPASLGLEGEPLVDAFRVEGGEMGAEGRHAVLARGEGDVAGAAGDQVPARGSVGVELADGGHDRSSPGLDAGTLHLGQALVEHLVHVAALLVGQRGGGGGRGIRDGRCDRAAAECGEHARHGADESAGGGEAGARGGGRAVGREGDVGRGSSIGLADELLERREEVVLVGDVVPCRVDPVAEVRLGEGDEGAGLERREGAERAVDHVQQVLDLLPRPSADLEHLLRVDRKGGEQVVDVPEELCERGRTARMQLGEHLLRSVLLRGGLRGRRRCHGPILPRTPDRGKARRKLWTAPKHDSPDTGRRAHDTSAPTHLERL